MKDIRFKEITIIGPGLIGASLGLILKKKKIAIICDFLTQINILFTHIIRVAIIYLF